MINECDPPNLPSSDLLSLLPIIPYWIVVHFTASWCMPSVAMNPCFEELASNYPDVPFLAVDVDELKEVASRIDIKAVPTFALMKNGAQVDKLVGANPDEIKKRVDSFVQSIRIEVA